MSVIFGRIPKWIKTFPHELDRAALINIAKKAKNFSNPREIIFYIYGVRTNDDAESMVDRAKAAGWQAKFYKAAESDMLTFEASKRGYIFTEAAYIADVGFFQRLASEYGAHYDGWVASLE